MHDNTPDGRPSSAADVSEASLSPAMKSTRSAERKAAGKRILIVALIAPVLVPVVILLLMVFPVLGGRTLTEIVTGHRELRGFQGFKGKFEHIALRPHPYYDALLPLWGTVATEDAGGCPLWRVVDYDLEYCIEQEVPEPCVSTLGMRAETYRQDDAIGVALELACAAIDDWSDDVPQRLFRLRGRLPVERRELSAHALPPKRGERFAFEVLVHAEGHILRRAHDEAQFPLRLAGPWGEMAFLRTPWAEAPPFSITEVDGDLSPLVLRGDLIEGVVSIDGRCPLPQEYEVLRQGQRIAILLKDACKTPEAWRSRQAQLRFGPLPPGLWAVAFLDDSAGPALPIRRGEIIVDVGKPQ